MEYERLKKGEEKKKRSRKWYFYLKPNFCLQFCLVAKEN
jgi:hypothetical protein